MTFKIVQGDNSPSLLATLGNSTNSIDFSNVTDIRFIMQDKYERVVINEGIQESVNLVNNSSGEVEFVFNSDQTSDVGKYEAEFKVEYKNGSIETFPASDTKINIEILEEIA